MAANTNQATQSRSSWWPLVLFVGITVLAFKFNPLEFVMETGPSAYYQARVVLKRGGRDEQYDVSQSLSDGQITQREYSVAVFPAFLTSAESGALLFPESESGKTLEQQRAETLQLAQMPSSK